MMSNRNDRMEVGGGVNRLYWHQTFELGSDFVNEYDWLALR